MAGRSNASIRKSTYQWMKKAGERHDEHDRMVHKFERNYDERNMVDNSLEPISILTIDGGGLRGYGAIKIMEAIEDSNMERGDFLGQFDLISGTSVGGVMTLMLNVMDTSSEAIAEASDCLDECRETAFESISVLNLLLKGSAVKSENSLKKVFEKRYGDTPLYNPNGVPAVVTAASRRDASDRNSLTAESRSYRPLLLRTYDYPEDEGSITNPFELAESTSHVKLIEAMAATSAVPGLVERVPVDIDGERRSLADGYLFANDPTVIALNEARKLYPRRPIGLVMSIGFTDEEMGFANRAIAIARLSHPDLHYQRIDATHVFEKFSPAETRIEKIAMLEEEAYNYVLTDVGVQRLLECSLEKLFKNRSPKKWQEVDEDEREHFKSSIDSMEYQRRTKQRMSILPAFMLKSKRLVDYRKETLDHLKHENVSHLPAAQDEISGNINNTFNDHHDDAFNDHHEKKIDDEFHDHHEKKIDDEFHDHHDDVPMSSSVEPLLSSDTVSTCGCLPRRKRPMKGKPIRSVERKDSINFNKERLSLISQSNNKTDEDVKTVRFAVSEKEEEIDEVQQVRFSLPEVKQEIDEVQQVKFSLPEVKQEIDEVQEEQVTQSSSTEDGEVEEVKFAKPHDERGTGLEKNEVEETTNSINVHEQESTFVKRIVKYDLSGEGNVNVFIEIEKEVKSAPKPTKPQVSMEKEIKSALKPTKPQVSMEKEIKSALKPQVSFDVSLGEEDEIDDDDLDDFPH